MNLRKSLPFKLQVDYHVKAEVKGHDLVFDTRQDARMYKRLLERSKSNIKSKIVRHEHMDGMIADRDVS